MTTLAERYFRPKSFEMDGRLHRWLGVLLFKRILMSVVRVGPSRPAPNACVLGGRSLDDVRQFEQKSRRSEIIHLVPLAMALAVLSLSMFSGRWSVAGMLDSGGFATPGGAVACLAAGRCLGWSRCSAAGFVRMAPWPSCAGLPPHRLWLTCDDVPSPVPGAPKLT